MFAYKEFILFIAIQRYIAPPHLFTLQQMKLFIFLLTMDHHQRTTHNHHYNCTICRPSNLICWIFAEEEFNLVQVPFSPFCGIFQIIIIHCSLAKGHTGRDTGSDPLVRLIDWLLLSSSISHLPSPSMSTLMARKPFKHNNPLANHRRRVLWPTRAASLKYYRFANFAFEWRGH